MYEMILNSEYVSHAHPNEIASSTNLSFFEANFAVRLGINATRILSIMQSFSQTFILSSFINDIKIL